MVGPVSLDDILSTEVANVPLIISKIKLCILPHLLRLLLPDLAPLAPLLIVLEEVVGFGDVDGGGGRDRGGGVGIFGGLRDADGGDGVWEGVCVVLGEAGRVGYEVDGGLIISMLLREIHTELLLLLLLRGASKLIDDAEVSLLVEIWELVCRVRLLGHVEARGWVAVGLLSLNAQVIVLAPIELRGDRNRVDGFRPLFVIWLDILPYNPPRKLLACFSIIAYRLIMHIALHTWHLRIQIRVTRVDLVH